MSKDRVVLDEDDLFNLLSGRVVEKSAVEIILSDIGFNRMEEIFREVEDADDSL